MMKSILVEVKNVYGEKLVYPICDNAKTFAAIAKTLTLTRYTLTKIEALGYEIFSLANADYRDAR